jgi:hypothetical protein
LLVVLLTKGTVDVIPGAKTPGGREARCFALNYLFGCGVVWFKEGGSGFRLLSFCSIDMA